MKDQHPKHTRRVRYKGTHPRSFKEKYKELDPQKYKDDIEKVISQGRTPNPETLPRMELTSVALMTASPFESST